MKRLAFLFVAFAGIGLALAGPPPIGAVFATETQSGTRALPTGTCGSGGLGGSLTGITSMHATLVCTDSSEFADAGATSCVANSYFCDPGTGQWAKAATYNDFAVPTATGQLSDGGWLPSMGPELKVQYPFGRFLYAVSGCACTGASWDGGILVVLSRAQQ